MEALGRSIVAESQTLALLGHPEWFALTPQPGMGILEAAWTAVALVTFCAVAAGISTSKGSSNQLRRRSILRVGRVGRADRQAVLFSFVQIQSSSRAPLQGDCVSH